MKSNITFYETHQLVIIHHILESSIIQNFTFSDHILNASKNYLYSLAMNYAFLILTIIVFIQELYAKLPDYVHVHTFEEIIETNYVLLDKLNICDDLKNMNNRILIAIKTAANNYIQRQIVRQTWLIEVKEHHIPYVFVLGSTNDEKLIDEILDEDNIYNDLLIGKPVDNYYNLTLKAMFIFAWTKVHCPSRWLFYVDDDTIINAQQVIDFISLRKNVLNRVLYCHMGQHFARRNPQSKWFVPMSIWEPALYPKYCQGWGWLIPPNVLSLLHDTSISNLTEPKLWIDDVFMTGIVAEVAGIELIESPMACCGRRDSELYEKSLLLAQMGFYPIPIFVVPTSIVPRQVLPPKLKPPLFELIKFPTSSSKRFILEQSGILNIETSIFRSCILQ
ncbi:unnamed protein product [Adineta steineri]|uniref:Hexosyltransferase n=2 Tax=Adineta steineri TaxID=433720 RepID=A0A819YQY6_9BILA|nr:unnamed protein product [Adineta steineri]